MKSHSAPLNPLLNNGENISGSHHHQRKLYWTFSSMWRKKKKSFSGLIQTKLNILAWHKMLYLFKIQQYSLLWGRYHHSKAILKDTLFQSTRDLCSFWFTFQQDNDLRRTVSAILGWCKTKNLNVSELSNQSSDLNPIENL